MLRFLFPLVLLTTPALAITPGKVPAPGDTTPPAPEALIPIITLGFARFDCVLPLSTGQQSLAEAMAGMLHADAAALRDRDGPWNDAIGAAFTQLRNAGRAVVDQSAGTITLQGCRD